MNLHLFSPFRLAFPVLCAALLCAQALHAVNHNPALNFTSAVSLDTQEVIKLSDPAANSPLVPVYIQWPPNNPANNEAPNTGTLTLRIEDGSDKVDLFDVNDQPLGLSNNEISWTSNYPTSFKIKAKAVSTALNDVKLKISFSVGNHQRTAALTVVKTKFVTPAGDPVAEPVVQPEGLSVEGANEFVYSGATVGVMTINLKARVDGVSGFDATIQNGFSFDVANIGSSTKNWATANPNGKPTVSGDYLLATVTFTGLPANNSDFGTKMARILFNGSEVAKNNYEVFFSKVAKNHPGAGAGETPNWFYYWKQDNVCGIPSSAVFVDTDGLFGSMSGSGVMTLYRAAAGTNLGAQDWTHKGNSSNLTTTGAGLGIQCVAEVVEHELHHKTIKDYFGFDYPFGGDGDGIDDDEEDTYGGIDTIAGDPDTYNLHLVPSYGGYASVGDAEVRCLYKERQPLSVQYYPGKDWAYPGCQSFIQYGPTP